MKIETTLEEALERASLPLRRKMETAPKPDVYHLTTPNGNLYFIVEDGVVTSQGMRTDIPFDRFIDFLHTAELLGFKIGKI